MLLYLHGFNSTPQSRKVSELRAHLRARGLDALLACPQLPHWPREAIAIADAEIQRAGASRVTLVGSSLGGYYATALAERYGTNAVLLNPAVHPARDLSQYLGPQQNLYSGERYALTEEHLRQLAALAVPHLDPARYLIVVETGDEVLDYRETLERYRGARSIVVEGGDHALASFPTHIPAILEFAGIPNPPER